MEIKDFLKFQKEFDSNYSSKFNWDVKIDESNLVDLQYLLLATVGELGETANIVKKVIRGDKKLSDVKEELDEEVIDVFIYLLKLIYQLDIDLEVTYKKKMAKNKIRFEKYKRK